MEPINKQPSAPSDASSLGGYTEMLWLRYSRQITIAAVVAVIAVAGWFGWKTVRERAEVADNKRLGRIYVMLHAQDFMGAEQALTSFLAESPSRLAADKANLFLGKIYFSQQRYAEAADAYAKVRGGKSTALIRAGALHGLAASRMQLGQYGEAAEALDVLVKEFAVRTGDPEQDLEGEISADLSPNVPNALWKLALCRRELGQSAEAKAAAERLVRAYPGSREAQDAERLLTTL